MNKSDLVRKVSKNCRLTQPQVEELLNLILDTLTEALASEPVTITNFGKFEVRVRKPTVRRNPRTGDEVKVPETRALLFHAAPAFKKAING